MQKKTIFCVAAWVLLLLVSCNPGNGTPPLITPVMGTTGPVESDTRTPAEIVTVEPPIDQATIAVQPTEALPSLKVVYIKEGNLWYWSRQETRQLTNSGDAYEPRLSPDGLSVAYTRQIDNFHLEIWAVNLDGGERRLIGVDAFEAIAETFRDPNAVAVNPRQFEWVPDSRILAFNCEQVYEDSGSVPLDDLQMVNADTFDRWALLKPGEGGDFTYSPSGRQIAIVTPSDIRLMDGNAGNQRNVLNYPQVATYAPYRYYAQPVWIPDEAYLLVAIPPADPLALPQQATSLYHLPIDGSPAYQIGSVFSVPFFDTPVFLSPNLEYLVYLYETDEPNLNRRDLRISRTDRSSELVYQNGRQMRLLGWNPNSTHFAFFMLSEDTGGDEPALYIGSMDGPPRRFAAEPYRVYQMRWVNEQHFLYLSEKAGGFELYLASLGGENTLINVLPGFPPAFDFIWP